MRRLRAQKRRLEEELQQLGGASFTAKPTSGERVAQFDSIGFSLARVFSCKGSKVSVMPLNALWLLLLCVLHMNQH